MRSGQTPGTNTQRGVPYMPREQRTGGLQQHKLDQRRTRSLEQDENMTAPERYQQVYRRGHRAC